MLNKIKHKSSQASPGGLEGGSSGNISFEGGELTGNPGGDDVTNTALSSHKMLMKVLVSRRFSEIVFVIQKKWEGTPGGMDGDSFGKTWREGGGLCGILLGTGIYATVFTIV